MAQIIENPLLSLFIPIYNRLPYLEKQLERFLDDKELFDEQVQLLISDNCSTDNIHNCCERYHNLGLMLEYHRNETNLGPDGNFDWCFHHAKGKYIWLLGSDDILIKGMLKKIIGFLAGGDFGLIHLSERTADWKINIFNNPNDMVVAVNYYITFISANIIRTDSLKTIDLSNYMDSFMIQVPAYINACFSSQTNAVLINKSFFEEGADFANNGGYNLFEVFVSTLFGIYERFVMEGLLSKRAYEKIKRIEYKDYLVKFIVQLLIFRKENHFILEGSWRCLLKYYGTKPYAYYYLLKAVLKRCVRHVFNVLFLKRLIIV